MTRCINKACQGSSYIANYAELSNGGMKLDMYIQHQRCNGETKKSYYYYITKNGTAKPTLPSARNAAPWEADVVAVNRLLPPATSQRPELVNVVLSTNDTNKKRRTPPPPSSSSDEDAAGTKRTRRHGRLLNGGSSIAPSCDDVTSSPDDDAILASSSEERHLEAALDIAEDEHSVASSQDDIHCRNNVSLLASSHRRSETYWDSPEAKKLFRPLDSEPTAIAAIDNQIKALRHVNKSANACVDIIAGNLEDELKFNRKHNILSCPCNLRRTR
ncbi:hypothetical protein MHU86_13825 [Fragilaria crotonensis]|nr:hypothetical protein MHU86_13825 [Fragilaria crotonensis]